MLLLRKHEGKIIRMSLRINSGGFDDCIPTLWEAEAGGSQTRNEPRLYPAHSTYYDNFKFYN